MNRLQSITKEVMQNESLMRGYASSKCKDCLGRGYVELLLPGEIYAQNYLCSCVYSRLKKECEKDESV